MTTIALRDGVMAADKLITRDGHKVAEVIKIIKCKFGIVGVAGDWDVCHTILKHMQGDAHKLDALQEEVEGKADALAVDKKGQVWMVDDCGMPYKVYGEFFAIGSGAYYAMGAMAMGATAEQAVLAATRFDCCTGGGIDIIKL